MKRQNIKQHIIEVASNLFYKNGYNSTGINEIISEAGIAKATLYNHFQGKEEICIAYLHHKNSTFLDEISKYCLAQESGRSQILGLFDYLGLFFEDKDFNGCWCIKTVAEIPSDNTNIRSTIKSQKNRFISLIEHLIQSNKLFEGTLQAESISKRIYLLYESAVAESHLHQMPWPIYESKNICKLLLE